MQELKKKVEALLFSSGRRMSLDELSKLCRRNPGDIKKVMNELKKEYEEKKSSLMVIDEGDFWKLTTKEDYLHLVKSIVTKTELTKTLMETLAVVAFKYPIKQSDLIKIRTNKAYDHLKELEEMGYITRQKYGRTRLIKLAQKFFDYFSLPQDKLKDRFKDFEGLAKAIEDKEEEIKKIKEEQKKMAKEAGQKEVDLVDDKGHKVKLKVVDEPEEAEEEEAQKTEPYTDKLGDLEVVDEPEGKAEEPKKEEKQETEEEKPEEVELPSEVEEKVDKRVEEILGGEDAEEEQPAEEPKEEQEEAVEEKPEKLSDVDKKIDAMMHPEEEEKEELHEIDKSKWGKESEEQSKDLLEASFEEKSSKKNSKKDKSE